MMNKDAILSQLMALDFVAVDLQLYLDTHPNDDHALMEYNKAVKESHHCRSKYERMYGPLCSFRSATGSTWEWTENPWPWQYQFNFEVKRREMI